MTAAAIAALRTLGPERRVKRMPATCEADFADKLLSALRYEFGGHLEKAAVT
jgi:6-phosphogluconate dehydrogenase (decarboxylating)